MPDGNSVLPACPETNSTQIDKGTLCLRAAETPTPVGHSVTGPVSTISGAEVYITLERSQGPSKTFSYPILSQYRIRNVLPGVCYPDWFGAKQLSDSDRQYLVDLYNAREWIKFGKQLDDRSAPRIQTKDGRVLRLQPFFDLLSSFAGAINPESGQIAGNARRGVVIKPRDTTMDAPSDLETDADSGIQVIDKELGWYRRRYVPPTIGPATLAKPSTLDVR